MRWNMERALERVTKAGCRVVIGMTGNWVIVPITGVGQKTWGAIDYLKRKGFKVTRSHKLIKEVRDEDR